MVAAPGSSLALVMVVVVEMAGSAIPRQSHRYHQKFRQQLEGTPM